MQNARNIRHNHAKTHACESLLIFDEVPSVGIYSICYGTLELEWMLPKHSSNANGNTNTARKDLTRFRRFKATADSRRGRRPRDRARGGTHGKCRSRCQGRANRKARRAPLDLRCDFPTPRRVARLCRYKGNSQHMRGSGRHIECICFRSADRTSVLDARLSGPTPSFSTSRWPWRASKIERRKEKDHAGWRQNRT